MTPNKLTLTYLLNYLHISDNEDIEEIKQLLDDIEYPINDDDSENIILSPNAFEQLLSMLDYNKYTMVKQFRKLYIEIKNTFLKYLHTTTKKIQKMREHTLQTISVIINNSYKRAERDCFTKCNKDAKIIKKLQIQLDTYTKFYNDSLPRNRRGLIRGELIDVPRVLIIGKPIIPEIPEIIYTGSNDDYIELGTVETWHEINIKIYKFNKCVSTCIRELRTKLNISITDTKSSIFDNLLLGCKIAEKKKYKFISQKKIEDDIDINSD